MRRPISRRDFIKGTAVVVAASVLTGCTGEPGGYPSSSESSPDASGSSSSSAAASSSSSSAAASSSSSSTAASSTETSAEKKSPWSYMVLDSTRMTAVLTGYDATLLHAKEGVVVLPDKVDGYRIVKIASKAFRYDADIQQVTIPGTVTLIENRAFGGCKNLKSVTMLEGGVAWIGANAFEGCNNLETVQFSSTLEHIESMAFVGDTKLNHIVIPENTNGKETIVEHCAFQGCTALVKVYIPRSMKKFECPFSFPAADKELYYQGSREEWEQLGITDKMDIVGDSRCSVAMHYNAIPQDARME